MQVSIRCRAEVQKYSTQKSENKSATIKWTQKDGCKFIARRICSACSPMPPCCMVILNNILTRIDHMEKLRKLQDETGGFNTFIPLKFRNKGNDMSYVSESSVIEDMRLYALLQAEFIWIIFGISKPIGPCWDVKAHS